LIKEDHRGFFSMRYTTTRAALNGTEYEHERVEEEVVLRVEFMFMRSFDSFLIRVLQYDAPTDEEILTDSQQYAIDGEQTEG
jgi:hypothetical protein